MGKKPYETKHYVPYHPDAVDGFLTVTLFKRFDKKADRWTIVTSTGRPVGWICRSNERSVRAPHRATWDVRVCSGAYQGTGPTDEGYVLDKVPSHLTKERNGEPYRYDPVYYHARTIEDAMWELAHYLTSTSAPAVGFDAHPDVITWASRRTHH